MKKTLAILMAVAMALGAFASLAFVSAPTTATRSNAPIGIDMWATDAMATTQGTRIWTSFVDKSEDLYSKSSLIYFVMQLRAYNSVQNTDVIPASVTSSMDVVLSSSTVDLSLTQLAGGVVLTTPLTSYSALFSGTVDAVQGVSADALITPVSYQTNVYEFDINYTSGTGLTNQAIPGSGVLTVNIQEGKAANGVASYTDYYVGFVGLTTNEITAKGSVVANIGYDGSSEEFTALGTTLTNGLAKGYLEVTKGDRSYLIVKNDADTWAAKTTYIPTYADQNVYQLGYSVFVKVTAYGTYNYVAQLDTEVTAVDGYGYSLGITVDKEALDSVTTSGSFTKAQVLAYSKTAAYLTKVLPYTFLTTQYVLAEDAVNSLGSTTALAGTDAFTATQLAAFETFLSDFGFSTSYTYKLQDSDFTVSGSYAATITAEYNGGQVVAVEPEDDEDEIVDEPTDEEPEIEEEEPEIEEEEEEVDWEEEEVPAETGDFSANIALVLAVSALLAGAALRFALKRVNG